MKHIRILILCIAFALLTGCAPAAQDTAAYAPDESERLVLYTSHKKEVWWPIVWRGDVPAQRSFAKLLLYISLFPQLIAGPIVRYSDVAAQIDDRHGSSRMSWPPAEGCGQKKGGGAHDHPRGA